MNTSASMAEVENLSDLMQMRPIGYLRSVFQFKNGTPRQPSLCSSARGSLTVEKCIFNNPEHALEGLEEFSHVWIMFVFHKNRPGHSKAKVKPPRLNGKRVGVFSTRSPYRPNAIGLTLAKIERISGATVHLSGIDIVDGTPVLDIKPFIPRYDVPVCRGESVKSFNPISSDTVDGEVSVDAGCGYRNEMLAGVEQGGVKMFSSEDGFNDQYVCIMRDESTASALQSLPSGKLEPSETPVTEECTGKVDSGEKELVVTPTTVRSDVLVQKFAPCHEELKNVVSQNVKEIQLTACDTWKDSTGIAKQSLHYAKMDENEISQCGLQSAGASEQASVSQDEISGAPSTSHKRKYCHEEMSKSDRSVTKESVISPGEVHNLTMFTEKKANNSAISSTSVAQWLSSPPVTKLCVSFTRAAEGQLQKFGNQAALDKGSCYRLDFLTGVEDVRVAVVSVLSEDPRSVYRREKCADALYFFTVDQVHVTCWFDKSKNCAEVLRLQPLSFVDKLQTSKV